MYFVKRYLELMRIVFGGIPLPTWWRMLMPFVFILVWTALSVVEFDEETAFVWAAIVAHFSHIWTGFPTSVRRHPRTGRHWKLELYFVVAVFVASFAWQIFFMEAWASQRLLSLYCALYLLICFSIFLESSEGILDRLVPWSVGFEISQKVRFHFVKINGVICCFLLCINEALIIMNTSINFRVVILALTPLILHYLFHVIILIGYPSEE